MNRRKFMKSGAGVAAASAAVVASPNIVTAQAKTFSWKMTRAWSPTASIERARVSGSRLLWLSGFSRVEALSSRVR